MSTVYIINSEGIIIDSIIAYSSYRDSRGDTYKPRTQEEERELLQFSENNKKIKELKAQLEELKNTPNFFGTSVEYAKRVEQMFELLYKLECQKLYPEEFSGIMDRWDKAQRAMSGMGADQAVIVQAVEILQACTVLRQKVINDRLKWTDDFNRALEKIKMMRGNASKLEELMFYVETTEGTEMFDAEVDIRTKGALRNIYQELDKISETLEKSNSRKMEIYLKRLDEIEEKLVKIPQNAESVFAAQIWREEQAQNVIEKLLQSGWKVKSCTENCGVFDDMHFLIENSLGNKAAIIFTIKGETRIESFFGENGILHKLQQTVLDTLIKGGDQTAFGRCIKDMKPGLILKEAEQSEEQQPEEQRKTQEETMIRTYRRD